MTKSEIKNMTAKEFAQYLFKLNSNRDLKMIGRVCAIRLNKSFESDQKRIF
jgi:hypothetical protein